MAKTKPSINASNRAIDAFLPGGEAEQPQQTAAEPQRGTKKTQTKRNTSNKAKAAQESPQEPTAPALDPSDLIRLLSSLSAEDRASVGELFGVRPAPQGKKERKTYHLHALIKPSTADRLEKYAQKHETSKAIVLENAILAYLDEKERKRE